MAFVYADEPRIRAIGIEDALRVLDLRARFFPETEELEATIAKAEHSIIVVADPDPEARIRWLRSLPYLGEVAILAVADGPAQISTLLDAGATDVICCSGTHDEALARIRAQVRQVERGKARAAREHDAQVMLELTQALASSLDFSEILYTVVRRIAAAVNVDRASIVLAPETDAGKVGYVVATSDNQQIQSLRIDLDRYPEILEVLRTSRSLTIRDASTHPVLEGIRENAPGAPSGSLSLFPIVWQGSAMGVLFLRARTERGTLTEREIDFCQIVANATAVALRNARVMQTLRDQTQQVNFARFEAERRLRVLSRYADLFLSAADGLAAVDPKGQLLFANPRAYEIVGIGEEQAKGENLLRVIDEADRPRTADIWRQVRAGSYPRGVDLRIRRGDGSLRTISCSVAMLQDGDGAVLFSFRDVTEERETARELAATKDFLESLIDASVDGIIAADLSGKILLFNSGAERIYGYKAEELVGSWRVRDLYPRGGAEEVMRMIRSPQHGGVGRLESVRFEALDRNGRSIPINLSAALIYDGMGNPFATVGIFADLRDKIRVEERLMHAQQQLAITEKQALIAELAGTAAHELNQPLTSVIAYGQMLQRKLEPQSADHNAAIVIVREAERMAEIVRKIGRITRYETKSYVGAQKILDLDASSADSVKEGTGR